jgi:hypothetical protein
MIALALPCDGIDSSIFFLNIKLWWFASDKHDMCYIALFLVIMMDYVMLEKNQKKPDRIVNIDEKKMKLTACM